MGIRKNNMKYFLFAFLTLASCSKNPPCPESELNNKPMIFSEELGSVNIDGEECKIYQTFQQFDCRLMPGSWHKPYSCNGEFMDCSSYNPRVLTRITKCPSQTTVNTITHTSGKIRKEVIR